MVQLAQYHWENAQKSVHFSIGHCAPPNHEFGSRPGSRSGSCLSHDKFMSSPSGHFQLSRHKQMSRDISLADPADLPIWQTPRDRSLDPERQISGRSAERPAEIGLNSEAVHFARIPCRNRARIEKYDMFFHREIFVIFLYEKTCHIFRSAPVFCTKFVQNGRPQN